MNVDGEKCLFHKELCLGHWQQAIAARARVAAEKERRAIQKHDERQAKMQRIRKRAEVISNPHTQQEVRQFRTREPQLSDVSLRDLLIEVANRIATRLDGIEQSGLRLQTLVDQLLRGGRA
jgi:hypothetical protein